MKLSLKHFFFGVAVLLAAALLAGAGYALKYKTEIDGMTPVATGKLATDVFAVRDQYVDFFLVKTSDGWMSIDAGISADGAAAQLQALKIDPQSVHTVLLTHSDADHTGALSLFTKANVYLTKQEEPLVTGKKARSFPFYNRITVPYHLLNNGQVLNVGGRSVKVILVPGHTPGSAVCVVDGKYLFAGDSMSLQNGRVEPFNRFFNMDPVAQVKNLPKLARLKGIQEIFTAHYGVSHNFVQAFELWPASADTSPGAD
jgi:hydroxyacylglutathione hydrolase